MKSSSLHPRAPHPALLVGSLALAGEAIYMLPYMRRSFQTSMEQVFSLTAFEIGTLNALFGVFALICYPPGGWLADRFSARRLLTLSLLATGLGGLYMTTLPGYAGLMLVHAVFGVFSVLTFWAALIKATRLWSASDAQGRAFGMLDGGRGLVGAALASMAAWLFGAQVGVEQGLRAVLILYSVAPLVAAAVVWWLVPDDQETFSEHAGGSAFAQVQQVAVQPRVWWLGVVIFCAYFQFVGSFDFPAYAERGLGQSKEAGAWLGAFRDWLRPLAALAAGLIADRIGARQAVRACFIMLVAGYGSLVLLPASMSSMSILMVQVVTVALAVFALRGIYFALLEESGIPLHLTGAAVGLVSFLAYTPDIIAPMLSGALVDSFEGATGYRLYFAWLAILGVVGWLAAGRVMQSRVTD